MSGVLSASLAAAMPINSIKIVLGEPNKEKAQLSMGQASEFSLSVEEYDINTLEADITAPSGKMEPCMLKKLPNGHLGKSSPHLPILVAMVIENSHVDTWTSAI